MNAQAIDLDAIVALARAAGAVIMRHYQAGVTARTKDDRSPVTDADEDAEALILKGLARIAPDVPAVSEEAAAAGRAPSPESRFFLVDPLDGTKEFLNRNGEFTVNIALVADGVPVLGVIYAPAIGRLFAGLSGAGAFEETDDGGTIRRRTIAVRTPPPEGMIAIASRSHRDAKTDEYLSHYRIADLRAAGSSLKFCLVAAGEADLYPRHGPTCEWDIAAGHAILAAAGGSVAQLDGTPMRYGKAAEKFLNPWFVARGCL